MTALVSDLLKARDERVPLADMPAPPLTLADAYGVQDAHLQQVLQRIGGRRIGYKLGATNQPALDALGLATPMRGPILSATAPASPAEMRRDAFFVAILESEVGFRMGQDLAPRSTAYTIEEVADAVHEIMPAIEVADSRIRDWQKADPRLIVSDLTFAGAVVFGAPMADWRTLDLAALPVTLDRDGAEVGRGTGAAVLGNPLVSLTALVNDMSAAGLTLKAGEVVSSGTCTPPYPSVGGGRYTARFGPLGEVTVNLI